MASEISGKSDQKQEGQLKVCLRNKHSLNPLPNSILMDKFPFLTPENYKTESVWTGEYQTPQKFGDAQLTQRD